MKKVAIGSIFFLFIYSFLVSSVYAQDRILTKTQIKESAKAQKIEGKNNITRVTSTGLVDEADISVEFSIKSDRSDEIIWSENFDAAVSDWTFTSTNPSDLYWSVSTSLSDTYSFKNINPSDVGSLVLESPYQYYKRGTSEAISPEIVVPKNGKLSFYLGCSTNFSKDCNLFLKVMKQGDSEWTSLWDVNSAGLTPANFTWRSINIDLSAYADQGIKLNWFYEGYMGNFYLDSVFVSGVKPINSIDVTTGQVLDFVDMSVGEVTAWEWSFPGGVPATSTEQNPKVYYTKDGVYDVTLTVSGAEGSGSLTKPGYVKVTGSAPIAQIGLPATFRFFGTRLPMIAPLQAVEFKDASLNFPEERQWLFTGVDENNGNYITTEENPKVNYMFQHKQGVGLSVENEHGTSTDFKEVSVEYEGLIWNVQPEDQLFTFNLDGGYGSFPGSNTLDITEYAEKFSKPSVPSLVYGANVYFSSAKTTEVLEQIATIRVAIHKSENGLPGEKLDYGFWSVFELDLDGLPTTFEFEKPIMVDDEFFIVVSGIPEYNDGCDVAFMTAKFRDQGNTSYFKQRDEWKSASSYFPAGANHTSYAVAPLIRHSVMAWMDTTPVMVGASSGTAELSIFSIMGYEVKSVSESWCRVTGEPNGMTLDAIKLAYDDLPEEVNSRSAILTISDGVQDLKAEIIQSRDNTGVEQNAESGYFIPSSFTSDLTIVASESVDQINVFDLSGKCVFAKDVQLSDKQEYVINTADWQKGVYVVVLSSESGKKVSKSIKK